MDISPLRQLKAIQVFAGLVGTLLAYLVYVIICRIFFHPLAKYPGPFLGKFTYFYPMRNMITKTRIHWQYEQLLKYGSPVRVSTNELLFSGGKAWADIYGQSSTPCLKEPVAYGKFTATGANSILNETDRFNHARLRRLVSHAFSLNALLRSEFLIHQKIETFCSLVIAPAAERGQSIDIFNKIMDHYLDIVSYLSFGKSFDSVSGHGEVSHNEMDNFMKVVPSQSFFPYLRQMPIKPKVIAEGYRGLDRLIEFARTQVRDFLDKADQDETFAKGTFLRHLTDARDEETGGSRLSFGELVENAIIFLKAGSDTTAITTMYLLLRRPLSAAFPRVSPGREIDGIYVPKGVVVEASAHATHRELKVYPDPEEWQPERWLDDTTEMRACHNPFSRGPRNCVGKHLAEIGLHLTVSRLYQLYDIEDDPSMTPAMMKQKDRSVAQPWGGKCLIRPIPRKSAL
ncbi:Versicolorin B desaturase [Fusarium acutatum]|uniref:Versicolorin B desaturase n=1 Tax=Fusarium acutatum TaxID=78861 RepID=A0A8H4J8T2_9HYPO|nr:Versicolorin B desaturase [Fusarium acutatum]